MITATIDRRDWSITVEGHAGGPVNRDGHDLVCCAVSTLMETMGYSAAVRGYALHDESRDGYMRLEMMRGRSVMTAELLAMYNFVLDGLRMLEDTYPGSLAVRCIF